MSITKTRQHLIDVAREIFARQGFDSTTMNDIAKASQRGRRTLYTYFRNKEDIFAAVIENELERLSEELDNVVAKDIAPDKKILLLIYTHLSMIKETVARNGNLRAQFFRNIWHVEQVRKKFDGEEQAIIKKVLRDGVLRKQFEIEDVDLMSEIIHYTIKGLEVPYIYNRLGRNLSEEDSREMVMGIIRRALRFKAIEMEPSYPFNR